MKMAQGLYEAGHITYMRTDSIEPFKRRARAIGQRSSRRATARIPPGTQILGENRRGPGGSRGDSASDVSVTPSDVEGSLDRDAYRLYEIIWQRTIACQMAEAVYDATSVDIESNGVTFRATGQILKFDGFLRVYMDVSDDQTEEVEGLLPELETGQVLNLRDLEALQHFTQPPPRYTEATLVKRMEEVGIGRPSTYAPTVRSAQSIASI